MDSETFEGIRRPKDAVPNNEERGQTRVPVGFSLARSSSSVSFALGKRSTFMKWSKLLSLLVAALGIGVLCCCGPNTFGTGLRDIHNGMNSWPWGGVLTLDTFAVLLIGLSHFLYHGRNWARLVLMAGCIGYSLLAGLGALLLAVDDANVADSVFLTGLLILCIAGPLLLFCILRRPEVRNEFLGPYAHQGGCTEPGDSASVSARTPVAPGR
jgi:hypothetical protein